MRRGGCPERWVARHHHVARRLEQCSTHHAMRRPLHGLDPARASLAHPASALRFVPGACSGQTQTHCAQGLGWYPKTSSAELAESSERIIESSIHQITHPSILQQVNAKPAQSWAGQYKMFPHSRTAPKRKPGSGVMRPVHDWLVLSREYPPDREAATAASACPCICGSLAVALDCCLDCFHATTIPCPIVCANPHDLLPDAVARALLQSEHATSDPLRVPLPIPSARSTPDDDDADQHDDIIFIRAHPSVH